MNITIKDIEKEIKGNRILDHISLEMSSGKVYGLKGYNGCGKTMLMRAICGLLVVDSGSIEINDKQIGKDIDFPESIGFLIENPTFLDGYTGFENLKIIANINQIVDDEEIREALVRVGLDPEDKRKYRKYSLGMKQRLGIAAAVFEKPELILLDEPLNALDTDGVEKTKRIIDEEKQRGALVVLTCHDKELMLELADVIFEIENGQIISVTE